MMMNGVGGTDPYANKPQYNQPLNDPSNQNTFNKQIVNELAKTKKPDNVQCQTCANRTYMDGSDDPGVSFKTPTKIDPSQAVSKVYSHEFEHYNREAAQAVQEDREVVSNSIRLFTSICPECGRTYVSGGETTTVTRNKPADKKDKEEKAANKIVDVRV